MSTNNHNKEEIKKENNWSTKISLAIALLGILVSGGQVWVAKINKERELRLAELRSAQEMNLKLAEFMAKHQDIIFSESQKSVNMQKIMLATFPRKIMQKVFNIFEEASSESESTKKFWKDAQYRAIATYSPRVKIFYERSVPLKIIDCIVDTLHEGDIPYDYKDQEIPHGMTQGDIRYFHIRDKPLALRVKKEFEDYCNYDGYNIELTLIELTNSPDRAPIGTVEIWLSGKQFSKNRKANKLAHLIGDSPDIPSHSR